MLVLVERAGDVVQQTVRYALVQGYLTPAQVREGLIVQQQLAAAGRPASLLQILASRQGIAAEHLADLRSAFHRYQQEAAQASGGASTDQQPEASAPPRPAAPGDAEAEDLTPLEVPQDVLERSGELIGRPPEADPDEVQTFLRRAESAPVALPDIPDGLFVALARKAGYPAQDALLACRRKQVAEQQAGRSRSLFSLAREEGLLGDRRVNRFLRWKAQVERREERPLEDEDLSASTRRIHTSAAEFAVVAATCPGCGAKLDEVAVLEGRAAESGGRRVCVACAAKPRPKGIGRRLRTSAQWVANKVRRRRRPAAAPAPVAAEGQGQPGRRGLRASTAALVRAVAARLGRDDPAQASRRLVQAAGWTAVAGVVCGVAVGALFSTRDRGQRSPEPAPSADETARAGGLDVDRAWALATEAAALPQALVEFARAHPGDPRSRAVGPLVAALRLEEEAAARAEETARERFLSLTLARAEALARAAPGEALALCRLVPSLAAAGALVERARALEERLAAAGASALVRLEEEAAEAARSRGPEAALGVLLAAPPAVTHGDAEAVAAWRRLRQRYARAMSRGDAPAEGPRRSPAPEPVAEGPASEAAGPSPTLAAGPDPGRRPTDPAEAASLEGPLQVLLRAFGEGDLAAVEAQSAALEATGAAPEELAAARGAREFLRGAFADAAALLAAAGEVGGGPLRAAYLRALLFTGKYAELRAALSPQEREDGLGALLLLVIDGPFRADLPFAADALETLTPDGRYRVVTDLGLEAGGLHELDGRLARSDERARAKLLASARRQHGGLRELAATMDKAYTAFDKLFGIGRAGEVVPTVYVFAQRARFDAWSRRLGIGATENTLGYYLPYLRILVFFDQGGGRGQRGILSQETLETLLHETFHQWLHLYVAGAPHWFNEGLAEYFGIAEMTRKEYRYGLVPPAPSRLTNIQDGLRGQYAVDPLPLDQLLLADRATFMNPGRAALNYAAAWSFVHYLASSDAGRKTLRRYFKALRGGAARADAFREVFGRVDMTALERDWRSYVLGLAARQ